MLHEIGVCGASSQQNGRGSTPVGAAMTAKRRGATPGPFWDQNLSFRVDQVRLEPEKWFCRGIRQVCWLSGSRSFMKVERGSPMNAILAPSGDQASSRIYPSALAPISCRALCSPEAFQSERYNQAVDISQQTRGDGFQSSLSPTPAHNRILAAISLWNVERQVDQHDCWIGIFRTQIAFLLLLGNISCDPNSLLFPAF
jgi:hypothetical protein